MKIRMLTTRRVSDDGFTVMLLKAGETYFIGHTAATAMVAAGSAVEVIE